MQRVRVLDSVEILSIVLTFRHSQFPVNSNKCDKVITTSYHS